MTPLPLDGLLNALLNEDALGQDLSDKDKASVRAMVRSLTEELPDLSTGVPPSEPDDVIAQFNALLSDLNLDSDKLPNNITLDDLFDQQSDSTLIDTLSDHVDCASGVVEVLSARPSARQALNELRRVELQVVALSIGVADLRQTLEQQLATQSPTLQHRIRPALLKEFHFINNWVRRR